MGETELSMKRCKTTGKSRIFIVNFMILLVVVTLVFLYGHLKIKKDVIYDEKEVAFVADKTVQIGLEEQYIEQPIRFENQNICGLALLCATFGKELTEGTIGIELLDSQGKIVAEQEMDVGDIIDNQYIDVIFGENIIFTDKGYRLRVRITGEPEAPIAFWVTEMDENTMDVNGQESRGTLVFQEIISSEDMFLNSYRIIFCIFVILMLVAYIWIFKFEVKPEQLYLYIGTGMAFIYMVVIPALVVPDEIGHYYSAYAVSNILTGDEDGYWGTQTMRQIDEEHTFSATGIDREYYNTYYNQLTEIFADNQDLIKSTHRPLDAPPYLFIISGIGLTFGRVLRFSAVWAFLLGRIFNLVAFVAAVSYAIKKIPFGKTVLFIWALLPMTLQQAMSYSYDSVILSMSVLVVSLTFFITFAETVEIKRHHWIILFACALLLFPVKSFALMPMSLLPFLIFFHKKKRTRNTVRNMVMLLFGCAVMFFLSGTDLLSRNEVPSEQKEHYIEWAEEDGFSLEYLLENPDRLFELVGNTLYEKSEFFFGATFGSYLGWMEIYVPITVMIPLCFALILAGMRKKEECLYLDGRMKLYMCFLAFLGIGFPCAGMLLEWTPASYDSIVGIQGRYFLPFILLLFMAVRSIHITIDRSMERKLLFTGVFMQWVIFTFIYLHAL